MTDIPDKGLTEFKRGDEIQLTIDDAAYEGKTVGRKGGFVVFVEGAVPGDVVRARLFKVKKNFAEAKVVAIEQPSPLRTTPQCDHFGVCGGCKWQHVDYEAQLRFKRQHVVDAFERIGGFSNPEVLPIIGSDEKYFYRNKMEFSFSDQEWLVAPPVRVDLGETNNDSAPTTAGGLQLRNATAFLSLDPSNPPPSTHNLYLGLHVPQRYDKVLDIKECHLQSAESNAVLTFTRAFALQSGLAVYNSDTHTGYFRFLVIRQSKRTAELMVNLVTFEDRPEIMERYADEVCAVVPGVTTVVNTINAKKAQIAFGEVEKVYRGSGVIHERLGNHTFSISASSFFQTNTAQAERLYTVARSFADLGPMDVVWDLYSGTGSIAMFVSDAVKSVIGIESVESAVTDARRNAERNNVTNCTFISGDLKDRLTKETGWMNAQNKPDVLIIDPPRSGMHAKVVEEILSLSPSRIVYVSCNPTTQARDVKLLCAEKYALRKLQPVDMFPHTYHIENVAVLQARAR